jgi:hypothetical protein
MLKMTLVTIRLARSDFTGSGEGARLMMLVLFELAETGSRESAVPIEKRDVGKHGGAAEGSYFSVRFRKKKGPESPALFVRSESYLTVNARHY